MNYSLRRTAVSGLMAIAVIGATACAGTTSTPPVAPTVPADQLALVVQNRRTVDVLVIAFVGDQRRRLGIVPEGTTRSYTFSYPQQDFRIALAPAGADLGDLVQIFASPYIDDALPTDAYYVTRYIDDASPTDAYYMTVTDGFIEYGKGGPPAESTAGGFHPGPVIVVAALTLLIYRCSTKC